MILLAVHPHADENAFGGRRTTMLLRATAAYAIGGGAVTLLGWFTGNARLTDWYNSGIAMFPNPALCAVLCGAALILLSLGDAAVRWSAIAAVRVLGGVVMGIAVLTLFEHVTHVNLGIDTLIADRPWGQAAAAAPMRMGPPASSSFTIIGVGLLLLTSRRRPARAIAAALGLASLGIATLSLLGYLYGAQQLYTLPRLTGIALQTATIIAAIAIGLILAVPERGLAGLLRGDDPGGAMARRLLVPTVLAAMILGWVRVIGQDANLYDTAFGTAARSLLEIVFFVAMLWWTARGLRRAHRAVAEADQIRRQDQQTLEGRDRLLASVTENARVGLVIVSPDHRYVYANREYARVLGLPTHQIIGQRVGDVLPQAYEQQIRPRLVRAFAGERVQYELALPPRPQGNADGSTGDRFFAVTYEPQREPREDAVGSVVVAITDITDRKRSEQARERLLSSERSARAEAEQAGRIKDEFLATLSHELRTPLNGILGWSQVLAKGVVQGEEVREGALVIERNARAQSQIIEDLLDMSAIVAGKVRLDVQEVDLAEVIEMALAVVRPAADAREIRLKKILDPQAGRILGDPNRLQQVLWNLLSNAVKFTDRGGRVTVTLARLNSHAEVSVSDTGRGIATDFLPHVFERFRQQDASTTRRHSGLGLGLAIVKQLVELHGGRVSVRSEGGGQGATFTVELPLTAVRADASGGGKGEHPRAAGAAAGAAAACASALSCDGPDLDGLKVLVVEDDADAAALICRVLEQCRAQVTMADSARQALEMFERHKPDVLVSDIGMPEQDGYDFIRAVRARWSSRAGSPPPARRPRSP